MTAGGGGGGSSYAEPGATGVQHLAGWNAANGSVLITYPAGALPQPVSGPGTASFSSPGAWTWSVPAGVSAIQVDIRGAHGMGATGGSGGRVVATLPVTPGEPLVVVVASTDGTWGGGGQPNGFTGSLAGGGASDLREGGGGPVQRIVVAAGGGGPGENPSGPAAPGGDGGGLAGLPGALGACNSSGGGAGSQTGGGAGGSGPYQVGGAGSFYSGGGGAPGASQWGGGGGGGGGYYGGGGGGACWSPGGGGGGGGSSYTEPAAANVTNASGFTSGAGSVSIAYPAFSAVGGPVAAAFRMANNRSSNLAAHCSCDPVETSTGNFLESVTDLAVPGRGMALDFTRSYNSLMAATDGPLGFGWTDSYAMSLTLGTGSPPVTATVNQENATQDDFSVSGTAYVAPPRVLASLVRNGDGTWTFTRRAREIFTFNAAGQLTGERDLNGYTTSLAYNGSGQLSSVTDPAGRSFTFGWSAGRIAGVTDTAATPQRSVSLQYNDGAGNLTDVIDAGGGHGVFTYDASHRLLTMRAPKYFGDTTTSPAPVTTNHYDAAGRVDSQTDALGHSTTLAYTATSTTIIDALGHVELRQFVSGMLAATTRGYGTPQAATWSYGYDPATLGVSAVTDPNGHTSGSTYDAAGNVLTSTDALGRSASFTYNALNEPLTAVDALGIATTMTYDAAGNPRTASTPLVGSSPATPRATAFAYEDAAHPGDVTAVTDPLGQVWHASYDAAGDVTSGTDPLGDETTYGYDPIGRRTSMVAANGNVAGGNPSAHTTSSTYDAFGRLLSAVDALGHQVIHNAYDANGNLSSATDATANTTIHDHNPANQAGLTTRPDHTTLRDLYDADGNLVTQADAMANTTTYAFADPALPAKVTSVTDPLGRTTGYGYDPVGNLVTRQDPGGNCAASPKTGCTTFGHDAADEETSVTYSDGVTPDVSGIAYDADGRRTSMTDGTGTSSWSFDSLQRLTSYRSGAGATVGYGYDLAGRGTSIAYPAGAGTVARAYDSAGRLTSVSDWSGNTTSFRYDADANLISQLSPNATTAGFGFNNADQLTAITQAPGATPGSPFATFSYGRDPAGRQASVTATGVPADTHSYSYSPLSQLVNVDTSATAYGYDHADNLVQLAGGAAQGFDAANQLCWATASPPPGSPTCGAAPAGATTYGFDARGNRTSATPPTGTAVSYGYDQAGRLSTLGTQAGYRYDGDGLRQAKTVGAATHAMTWDESAGVALLISDTQVTGTVTTTTSYLYGPGGVPLEQFTPPPAISLVMAASASSAVLSTSLTLSLPGVQAADQILVASTQVPGTAVTPPPGYTAIGTYTSGGGSPAQTILWRRTAVGGETSVTIGYPLLSSVSAQAAVYRGVDPAHPIDAIATGSTASGASLGVGPVTATLAGDRLVFFQGQTGDSSGASWTPPGGMTRQAQAASSATNATSVAVADQTQSGPGPSGSRTATFGATAALVGELVALRTPDTHQWLHADQLGSTRALTDVSGTVVGTFTYDPYGRPTGSTGTASSPFGYAGQYTDAESGLIYLRARYYDPATGQFLSRDPLVAITGEAYGYVGDNPLNGRDPSGLLFGLDTLAAAAVGGLIGGGGALISGLISGHVNAVDVVIATVAGAATGAAFDTCGACAGAVGGAVTDFASQLYHSNWDLTRVKPGEIGTSFAIGGLAGAPGDILGSLDKSVVGATESSLASRIVGDGFGIFGGGIDPARGFNGHGLFRNVPMALIAARSSGGCP